MHNVVYVTAIYNGLYGSPNGGRNRETMYKKSLLSIAKTGVPIYAFCFPWHVDELSSFFENSGASNVNVVGLNIFDFDFSPKVSKIKASDPQKYSDIFWQERCVEIMWGKTRLLKWVLTHIPNIDYIYWIDAGLSNTSILKRQMFPYVDQDDHFTSEGIFTETFNINLLAFSQHKIFCMLHTRPNNPPIPAQYNKSYYHLYYAMIGGLFGGREAEVSWFIDEVDKYIDRLTEESILFAEESIYTGIYNDNKERFSCFWFDTFYNEDWGSAYNPTDVSFHAVIQSLYEAHDE